MAGTYFGSDYWRSDYFGPSEEAPAGAMSCSITASGSLVGTLDGVETAQLAGLLGKPRRSGRAGPGPKVLNEWTHRKSEWERLWEAAREAAETVAEAPEATPAMERRAETLRASAADLERLVEATTSRVEAVAQELNARRAEKAARALIALAEAIERQRIEADEDDIEALLLAA